MRKFILLCLLVFTVSSVVFAQQMTDEQVILYVQEAQSQGKTQQEMLVELMKKGVTKEQIQRIQSKYSGKSNGSSEENANFMGEANSRLRTQKTTRTKTRISLRMNPAWIISVPKSKVLKGCGRNRPSNAMDMERG